MNSTPSHLCLSCWVMWRLGHSQPSAPHLAHGHHWKAAAGIRTEIRWNSTVQLKRTRPGIYTIDGGSDPLLVSYVFHASRADYSWWSIIDYLLYIASRKSVEWVLLPSYCVSLWVHSHISLHSRKVNADLCDPPDLVPCQNHLKN